MRTSTSRGLSVAAIVVVQAIPAGALAAGAPAQARNKTVTLSWTQTGLQRSDDGREIQANIAHHRTIYISSEGRIFSRASRSTRAFSKTGQLAPGETRGYGGSAAGLTFEGNELVGTQAHVSGAAQFRAAFDSSFSSCTVRLVYGRSGGAMRTKGLDGKMYTMFSPSASGQSCSIRPGNAFAE